MATVDTSTEDRPTRELILDAAEQVVARDGAKRLTIDAVVKQSGFSKGGVLYNFPSKLALVQGMVQRMVEFAQAEHARAIEDARAENAPLAPAIMQAMCGFKEMDNQVSMGLLAAVAEHPELIDPIREAMAAIRDELLTHAPDPELARIAMLAADGMHFTDILGLDVLTDEERAATVARLVSLVLEPSS
ncbi:MAG: TetR/AcrR family transcriptional regulator [Pseudomonadota bacterium]